MAMWSPSLFCMNGKSYYPFSTKAGDVVAVLHFIHYLCAKLTARKSVGKREKYEENSIIYYVGTIHDDGILHGKRCDCRQ